MKKLLIAFSFFTFIANVVLANHFWRGELMTTSEVKSRWGATEFDSNKFKVGKPETRAKMAFGLIQSKKYIGKTRAQVIGDLGPADGYYFSELIPAYIIQNEKKKGDEVWQIIFLLDKERHVTEVAVHKNCCDKN